MKRDLIPDVSLGEAVASWLTSLSSLSATSISAYGGEANRLGEHLATHRVQWVSQLHERHWLSYLAVLVEGRPTVTSRRTAGLKGSSALQAARITRSFLRYCWMQGWISWLPAIGSTRCSPSLPAPPPFEPPAVLAEVLLDSGADEEVTARTRVAAGLAFWAGLSPLQIASLEVNHWRSDASQRVRLSVPGRHDPSVLPQIMAEQFETYDRLRRDTTHRSAKGNEPLISQLGSYVPLSGNSVWAMLRVWQSPGLPPAPLGAKALRDSFAFLASEDARGLELASKAQTGRDWRRLRRATAAKRVPSTVTSFVLAKLQQI